MNESLGYFLLIALMGCSAGGVNHHNDISNQQQFAYETMDANHSGEIDGAEWSKEVDLTANEIAVTNKQQSVEYRRRMTYLFKELDKDHSLTLSRNELIQPK